MVQISAGVLVGRQSCPGLTADKWERMGRAGWELQQDGTHDAGWGQSRRVTAGQAAEKDPVT